ncbi:MAG: TonB-dependent receptor plug domain-containing protein, partial [Nostoc sp.]
MELLLQLRIWNWGFWLWFFLLSVSPALAEEQTNVSITAENVFEKFFAVTSDTSISPLTPLKKRVAEIKVSLFKGDLEGSKTFDTDKRTFQTSSEALFAQNTEIATEVLQVTAVKANPTGKGVEIILQTDQGQQLQITNRSADNSFIADIPNAQLRLSSGDAFTFRSQKPIEGITEITVTNFDANTIRVTVVGEAGVPVVELFDSPDEGLIFSVASTIASTPLQQPQPSQPESETQPEQPSTQGDEPIELVVMGEQDGYRVPNASTATRTDTPLRDIPQSIQVIPRQVLEDQGATSAFGLRDALRNVSGVQPAFTGGNTVTGRSIIRGFVQSSTFQDGFRSGDELLRDSANIERIEVLKGPASVLYGDVQPGGIINITTKQPL